MAEKKRKQHALTDFFAKKPREAKNSEVQKISSDSEQGKEMDGEKVQKCVVGSAWDIGKFVSQKLSSEEKAELIRNCWNPDILFKFPLTQDNRHFQLKWMKEFWWLRYSAVEDGAFCLCCVAFIEEAGVGNGLHMKAQSLVSTAFTNWRRAVEKFQKHQATDYHKFSAARYQGIQGVLQQGKADIIDRIQRRDPINLEKGKKNQEYLSKIVKVIILLARQAIALRGTEDYGKISIGENEQKNTGNFRALIIDKMQDDPEFRKAVENAPGNAMYTSPEIQNELIGLCGKFIQEEILQEVKDAQFVSVLADEASDVNMDEQLVVLLRYVVVDNRNNSVIIKEQFLNFIKVVDLTGRGLARTILSFLEDCGLDLEFLVGQGFDGASAMAGKHNGVQAAIREQYPLALYTHCANHALNLACVAAAACPAVKNTTSKLQKIIFWFTYNSQRSDILRKKIEESQLPRKQVKGPIDLCETRWVERHAAFLRFVEVLQPVILALDEISDSANGFPSNTQTAAAIFSGAIANFPFLVNLKILEKMASVLKNVSKKLQEHQVDLVKCCSEIQKNVKIFQNYRDDATVFDNLYADAEGTVPYQEIKEAVRKYERFLEGSMVDFDSEYDSWKFSWNEVDEPPATALEALQMCDKNFYPLIHTILRIFVTLPVTTASGERSFSAMKRVKTFVRASMEEDRFASLCHLHIHRSIKVPVEKIVKQFARKANRRADFGVFD